MEKTSHLQSILGRQRAGFLRDVMALILTSAYLVVVIDLALATASAR